jgi:outer membrane biosynthesis protein TonB
MLTVTLALATFFLLFAGSAGAAGISGIVNGSDGAPVVGATVTLYFNGQEAPVQGNPATTDFNGFYRFPLLPAGTYSLQAEKGGYTYTATATVAGSDVVLDIAIPGYTAGPAALPTPYLAVTRTPDPRPAVTLNPWPTATPVPPPTPTPKPTKKPTPIPLPPTPTPAPGPGAPMALLCLGIAFALARVR